MAAPVHCISMGRHVVGCPPGGRVLTGLVGKAVSTTIHVKAQQNLRVKVHILVFVGEMPGAQSGS